MLRPATLLPALGWLSTPRFDERPLDRRRGPATGLSGDYPRGTCTRWNDAARNDTVVRVHGWSNRFVRTHHALKIVSSGESKVGAKGFGHALQVDRRSRGAGVDAGVDAGAGAGVVDGHAPSGEGTLTDGCAHQLVMSRWRGSRARAATKVSIEARSPSSTCRNRPRSCTSAPVMPSSTFRTAETERIHSITLASWSGGPA